MIVSDRDRLIVVSFLDGKVRKRGPVIGWACRGKKICAIVIVKARLVDIPLTDLKVVSSRGRK